MSAGRRALVFSGMDDDEDAGVQTAAPVKKAEEKAAKVKKRRSFISFASRAVQIPSRPLLPRSSSLAHLHTNSDGPKPGSSSFSAIPRSDSADQLSSQAQSSFGRVRIATVKEEAAKAKAGSDPACDEVSDETFSSSMGLADSGISSPEGGSPRQECGVAAQLMAQVMASDGEEEAATGEKEDEEDGGGTAAAGMVAENAKEKEEKEEKPDARKKEEEKAEAVIESASAPALLDVPGSKGREGGEEEDAKVLAAAEGALRMAMDDVVLRPKRRSRQMAGMALQKSSPVLRATIETPALVPLSSSHSALGDILPAEEEDEDENLVGDYLLGGVLGEGTFGKVYKALHRLTGEFVAIKEIATNGDEEDMASVMSEVELLKRLNHPNIVQFKDIKQRNGKYYIALEFIENGSLKDVLKKFGRFPESLALVYIIQLLQGLSYLHDANIIHRDIKGANILITKNGTCKLADFGLAAEIRDKSSFHDPAGSVYWMAPELFEVDDECEAGTSKASDIWSLGCTVIELLTGSPPYSGMGRMAAIHAIVEDEMPPLPSCSSGLQSFLRCCLHKDPSKRKMASQLLGHPWIVGQTPQKSGDYHMLTRTLRDFRKHSSSKPVSTQNTRHYSKSITNSTKATSTISTLASFEAKKQEMAQFAEKLAAAGIVLPDELKATLTSCTEHMAKLHSLAVELHDDVIAAYSDIEELAAKQQEAAQSATSALQTTEDYRTKLRLLEQNFKQSDDVLARLVYGSLAMADFTAPDVKKGVLKVKKPHEKWKKRHMVLKDNFVFIYKPEDPSAPLDVVWLNRVSIQPQDAKVVGESFAFKLCTSKKWMYICAAKDSIMVGWMKALSFPTPWYDADDFGSLLSPRSPRGKLDEVTSRSRSLSSPKPMHMGVAPVPDRLSDDGASASLKASAKSPTMSPRSRPRSIFGMKRSVSKIS